MSKQNQKKTIRKVLLYIRQYWWLILLSLLFAAVSVVFTLYLPILTGDAVDRMIEKGKVDFTGLKDILARMVVVIAVTGVSQWVMNVLNNRITYSVVRDIRRDAFHKIQKLPVKYLDAHPVGDVVSRIIADVDQFADGLLMGFTQAFTGILTILGTLVFMLRINVWITLVVVVVTPLSFFVAAFIAKRTHFMFQKQSEVRGEQTGLIDEMIGNQQVVQAYGQEKKVLDRFAQINVRLEKYSLRATFFSSITNPATRFVNNLVYAGVGITGAFFAIQGQLSVGSLSCFLSYANQYTKPFNEISGVITELQNAITCAGRVFELIEEPEEAETAEKESEEAETAEKKPEGTLAGKDAQTGKKVQAAGSVQFDHVDFSYAADKPLIQNLNLEAKPGQRIAIVGPTGCGKTTIINLMMRFYDVTGGAILVDGKDIRAYSREALRSRYGMVLQETWLKDGTILENILFGREDAGREEAIQAAKLSHAHSFIKRLPNGYDTVIKENGDNLSQGQRQLLCIARVILCRPSILILDEATSSIDTRTEMKIQSAFKKLMEGRTSFIVAHRLSTIQNADMILVMKDGKIVEQGNHKTLLEKQGFYANLYESQFDLPVFPDSAT
ncbi:MAG: ABC transporter ATP-binding protein/permease [Clostridiaceae bacterium]|nr:ABC transporter ATP-binding protein/permease [Clostridiaceae bacterium]